MYTKEAIQYLIGQYTYGELDTSDFRIDIPVPNGVTPIWRSQGDSGTAVVDSVLRRIEDTYPPGDPGADYFALPAGYDYQRVGYVFVDKYDGLDTNAFAMSSEDNETWTGSVGQAIWNGATFAAATQWSGTSCGMWADRHSETGVGIIFHELLHHLIYACSENPLLGDRGIWDKHTRTWGFDVMDHNGGKPEPTNGHYGVPPLSPIDQYMLGFIKSAWYAEITNNSTDVRIRPRTTVLSPSSTDKLLYRIPMNEANVESFVISNHQGTGIDEVYNEGLGDTLTRGLQIWHISPLFRLAGGTATADVEVAWTLALGDTFRHPDGSRTWLVGDYLDSTHYHENLDWVDCSNLTDSPLYPAPAGKSLHIIQGAWGGYSCGTPGDSHGYYNNENGRSTWQFDTFTGNPTRNDFFTACKEFTPYTAPSTDTYHLYRADNVVGAADDCSGLRQLDPPREGALYTNSSPTGTHIALVNIRQEAGGDMLFDVYFNFWEGNFSHAKNFGAASTGYWGQEYDNTDTVVVGPNGFVVDSSRTLTIRSATTVRCLGGITVHGTLTVQSGVFFDTIKGDIVIASGGRLELGSNVTLPFNIDNGRDLHVNAGGTLIGSGSTSVIEGPINVSGDAATVENVKVLFADPYGTGQSIISVSGTSDTTTIVKDCILNGAPNENDHYGIGCSNASPRIRGVAIDTVYAGIYAYNGSDPVIYRPAVYDDPDCEGTVTSNLGASCYYGVQAYLNSEFQGGYYNPPNTRFGGNNFMRAASATGAHVYANNTGQQKLDYNYWNGGPDVLTYNGAYATTYPQCGSPFPRPGRSGQDERRPVFAAIDSAVAVLADHDTTAALDNLRALAGRQTEAMDALFVLDRITELCSPERVVSLADGLRAQESRPAVRQAAMWVTARARHSQGDLLDAAQWYAQVREPDADSLLATESKFAEAELLFDLAGQRDRALVLFREFLAEASVDNPNRVIARGKLKMAGQDGDEPEPRITRPASPPLLTARPNPFNPTTSITYRVTAQGNVSVQVYNALGQRVRELVNTAAPAGTYTVVWDGKDSAARPVGSGVYLIRLTTPAAVVTERVTLLR